MNQVNWLSLNGVCCWSESTVNLENCAHTYQILQAAASSNAWLFVGWCPGRETNVHTWLITSLRWFGRVYNNCSREMFLLSIITTHSQWSIIIYRLVRIFLTPNIQFSFSTELHRSPNRLPNSKCHVWCASGTCLHRKCTENQRYIRLYA